MTKEEIKANELIERFEKPIQSVLFGEVTMAAELCAIIFVDEIIKEVILFKQYSMGGGLAMEQLDFWQSVKQILESK